jgi:serine/threonine protein kinase
MGKRSAHASSASGSSRWRTPCDSRARSRTPSSTHTTTVSSHRDIKPENVLLQGGHALVADFGIALAVQQAGGERMTQTGLSLGTPQYMSPEQATGERQIDGRTDIYSLGAVT